MIFLSMKTKYFLLYAAILLALSPLIHSKSAVYGTVVYRTIYFWTIIDISTLFILLCTTTKCIKFSLFEFIILIYIFLNTISAIFGQDIYLNILSNFERMSGLINLLHFVVFFFVFSNSNFIKKDINKLLVISMLIGAGISIWGISEVLNGKHFRAESIMSNPMHLSIYVIIQFYLGIYCFYNWKNYPIRLFLIFYFLISFLALILTQTRAGIIALLVGIGIIILLYFINTDKKIKFIKISIPIIFILIGLSFITYYYIGLEHLPLLNRFSDFKVNEDTRLKLWKMSIINSFEKPFLGWGQGSFIYFYFKNFTSDLNDAGFWYDSSHNNFIDNIIGLGYIGFISYCSIFTIAFRTIWQKANNEFNQAEKLIFTGFLVSYLVFMFFGFDSFISSLGLYISFIFINRNSKVIWSLNIEKNEKLVKISLAIVLLASIYFFNYKSIKANTIISKANFEINAEALINQYEKAYDEAIIGKYDIAMEFALKKNIFLESNIPKEVKENYYQNANRILHNSLLRHKENPILLNQYGFIKYESGRVNEGIKLFELMNKLSPNRLINKHDYAWLLFKSNQVNKSIYAIDNVIKGQSNNTPAILLKARILFESKQPKEAFQALDIFDSKETIKYFKEITTLISEYQQYNGFYDFLYKKYNSNLDDFKLSQEQLLIWSHIAQLSKNKKQIYSVFSYYAGNTLLGDNSRFRKKQDSLKVIELIDKVYDGRESSDVVLTLKDFDEL